MSDMSDEHLHDAEEHNSGIRTPRQLILAVGAAFVVPVIVILMLTQFVNLENKEAPGTAAFAASAVAARIAPIGAVRISDPTDIAAARSGQQVFENQCTTCHASGALGAPKLADAAAWGPRIGKGYDALLASALHGKGNMPAQSGGDFSDFEIGRAVVYMANQSGGHLAEPKPPAAASAADAGGVPGSAPAAAAAAQAAAPSAPPPAATAKP
jgi:cytochrome c5